MAFLDWIEAHIDALRACGLSRQKQGYARSLCELVAAGSLDLGNLPADDEEAIALMNDCDYGLTASLWTTDSERAARIGRRLETGTVYQNRCDYLDPALCWTGVKETGRGGSLSVIGFHNLTRPKSYHLRKALA